MIGLVTGALLLAGVVGVAGGLVVAWLRRRGHRVLPDPAAALDAEPGPEPVAPAASSGSDRLSRPRPGRLVNTSFPFGPALAAGTMAAVLFSETLVG